MLRKLMGRFKAGQAKRADRGSMVPLFAVMSIPMLMSVGVGVDMTRMTLARSALQSAVDGAALAAAAAGGYSKAPGVVADSNAMNAATQYFKGNYTNGGQGPSVALGNPPGCMFGSPCVTTPPPASSGYKVTVAAQGTMNTTFLGLAKMVGGTDSNTSITSVTIKATATANNLTTPGTGPKLVLNSGDPGSTAADWNAAYIYAVPFGTDGVTPNYAYIPKASDLYLIGTNCPAQNASSHPSQYCYQRIAQSCSPIGAHAFADFPNNALDAPIAMVFINVTNGRASLLDVAAEPGDMSYGDPNLPHPENVPGQNNMNYYGARFGSCQVFMTALISLGQSPSKYADSGGDQQSTSAYILNNYINKQAIDSKMIDPITNNIAAAYSLIHPDQTTHYSEVSNSTKSNCLLVMQNIDPNAVPSNPPTAAPGNCFSVTDTSETVSGKENVNLSCNQMKGRTYMYWFNDMGWYPIDDKDYKNLYFSFRCTATGGSGTTGPATTPVSLLK